jgi:hypothetical protein
MDACGEYINVIVVVYCGGIVVVYCGVWTAISSRGLNI